MPRFKEARRETPSSSSDTTSSESPSQPTEAEQFQERGSVKYGRCVDTNCTSNDKKDPKYGELRRLAARGLCFSCYRNFRESKNGNLVVKRRAQRAEYARRKALNDKVQKRMGMIEKIKTDVLDPLRKALTSEQYAKADAYLSRSLREIVEEWAKEDRRRLKIVLQLEEIELNGGIPVIVDSRDVVRRDLLPPETLHALAQAGVLDGQFTTELDDLDEKTG